MSSVFAFFFFIPGTSNSEIAQSKCQPMYSALVHIGWVVDMRHSGSHIVKISDTQYFVLSCLCLAKAPNQPLVDVFHGAISDQQFLSQLSTFVSDSQKSRSVEKP